MLTKEEREYLREKAERGEDLSVVEKESIHRTIYEEVFGE